MPTPRPALSCRSCGSFEALPGGELCPACRHAVEVHGASFVDAYAVPCEGCDRPQIQTSPEAPIPCINCGSPACEWPGECDTKTIAERISRRFGDDGQRWRDANGTSLEDACTEANGRLDRSDEDDSDRYTFPDGSVLTLCDGGWDLGYPNCFCWQGGGHGDDCPACCDNCGADLHEWACPNCAGDPLDAPEEILDILNDLIEWDAYVGPHENEVWDRARAIRDRLVVQRGRPQALGDPRGEGFLVSRLDAYAARPYIVIQNDAGDYLAPGGVWTRDPNRRFNFAEFSGRELAEKLARLHSAKVVTLNPDSWAARPEGDEK